MTNKDKRKLLLALDDREAETIADGKIARQKGIEKKGIANKYW